MPTQHHSETPDPGFVARLGRFLDAWTCSGRLALILALFVALVLAVLVPYRAPLDRVWGDEGTFLAMMQSLARDGDLRFDERDAQRAADAEGGRAHLILQRAGAAEPQADDGEGAKFAYSKPVLFPLLAAPFYAVAGERGPTGLNLLLLALALWLARGFLHALAQRDGDASGLADLALVSFAAPTVILPYAFWRMSDSLQFSLALLGLVLTFGSRVAADGSEYRLRSQRILAWSGAPWLGAVLLAALVSLRVSNGLLAAIPLALPLLDQGVRKGWRRAAAMLLTVAASLLAFQLLTVALTGAENPYRAVRATFTPDTGYPVGPDADEVLTRFEKNRASHFTRIDRPVISTQVLYSSLYVWVGRHTGLFVYFPASLLLLWLAVRRSDLAGKLALAAFLGTLAFYVGWKPGNYFGGETFLANRYLLPAYPALLVALRRLPRARGWLPVWLLALLALGSATTSAVRCAGLPSSSPPSSGPKLDVCRSSQNHAYAGIFRLLPFESTSRRIDGVRDRYWAGEFVRFLDPWADVDSNAFDLVAGQPSAEMSVAHWRSAQMQVFRVHSSAPDATLVVEHGGDAHRFAVGSNTDDVEPAPSRGGWTNVQIEPQKSWRRHRFWFNESPYWVGTYRLKLESTQQGARAKVLFLGDPVATSRAISYELLGDTWPNGLERPLQLTLRNTSPLPWRRDDPVRVTLRWRLFRPAEGGHPRHLMAESGPLRLPGDVPSGGEVVLEVPVEWPSAPGRYEVEADLVLEQVAWFSQSVGSPVFRQSFRVPAPGEPAGRQDPSPRD